MHAEAVVPPPVRKGSSEPREPRIPLVGRWVDAGSVLRLAWAPEPAPCPGTGPAWIPGRDPGLPLLQLSGARA